MFKIHVAFSIQNSILTKSFPTILGIKYNQKTHNMCIYICIDIFLHLFSLNLNCYIQFGSCRYTF